MNPEQPTEQPEKTEQDLSKKEEQVEFVYAHPNDGLGWKCKQCELNNGWCERHPQTEPIKNLENESDMDSSMRIAEHEAEIAEIQMELEKVPTPEELDDFFKNMKKIL